MNLQNIALDPISYIGICVIIMALIVIMALIAIIIAMKTHNFKRDRYLRELEDKCIKQDTTIRVTENNISELVEINKIISGKNKILSDGLDKAIEALKGTN